MLTLFLQAFLFIIILVTLLWILSIIIVDASIVDLFWGMGFVLVNIFYFIFSGEISQRKILVLVLVTLWGFRLFIYLSFRNIGKGEDFRYQKFRQDYGPERYWWISFFQVFLLQGILIMLVSLPLLGVNYESRSGDLVFLDYLGIVIWLIGFVFESVGDYQLSRFKKNPDNKGKVFDKGLWKYTRHPNYFGDIAVWCSFAVFSVASGNYWNIAGSLIMTFLIIRVSGVFLLEKTLNDKKPEYKEYIRKTSAFIPWFPRK
ncbi:MAG: DUF1295 domain-containing protein [Bacteroidales bacterium]|nr:DUF1295 domain-containing protein [Bacteroidales bacterium]